MTLKFFGFGLRLVLRKNIGDFANDLAFQTEKDYFLEDFLYPKPLGPNGIRLDLNEFDITGRFLIRRNLWSG